MIKLRCVSLVLWYHTMVVCLIDDVQFRCQKWTLSVILVAALCSRGLAFAILDRFREIDQFLDSFIISDLSYDSLLRESMFAMKRKQDVCVNAS